MSVENEEESTIPESETPPAAEVNTPSLFDAITSALEPTLPKAEETQAIEETDEQTDEGDETTEEGGGETDESETEEGAQPRDKGGRFASADEKGKTDGGDGKPGAAKPGADGKPLAEGKKPDPVNDPIPEDVKGRTRERMQGLIDTVKAKDEVIQNQNTLVSAVKATGASPEEFAAMISYMGWVRSDDKTQLTNARDMLLRELEAVSLKLGEAAPGVDFISKHPDIKAMVDAGQITQEAAQELAISRARTASQEKTATATREQEEASARATKERNTAIAELDDLGKTLAASDPQFAAKHAVLEPVLASLGMLPPKQWKAAFMAAYKAVKLPAGGAPAGGAPAGGAPKGAPLRANKSPSGGQNRQPTSLLDAVSAAIDSVGQG